MVEIVEHDEDDEINCVNFKKVSIFNIFRTLLVETIKLLVMKPRIFMFLQYFN